MPPTHPARGRRLLLIAVALAAVAGCGWFALDRGRQAGAEEPVREAAKPPAVIVADVVRPVAGGIERTCVQPGTLEPFESADLFAKVSGFLVEQTVDIGSRVKRGQVLARISVPEFEKQVAKDAADVTRAEARVEQATAGVATAEADEKAAGAAVAFALAEAKSKTSYRAYREKQRERIKGLAAQQAIDAKLADEQEDQYQAAVGAELASAEAVTAAKQKEAAAHARVAQARADRKYAESEVTVARAQHEKSEVMLAYTVIRSPYDGVVTRRHFHAGGEGRPADFVRSADAGGQPLLSVERTDVMRLVVQVPDRDVPFVTPGDPAVVQIDALPGMLLESHGSDAVVIARSAESEDPATRTMRTEIDLKNTDGKLRRGMYGHVTLCLDKGTEAALRVPSAALAGKADGGKGKVRVVRGGVVQTVAVRYSGDNGKEVEIVSGLTPTDAVVLRTSSPVDDGTPVTVNEAKAGH